MLLVAVDSGDVRSCVAVGTRSVLVDDSRAMCGDGLLLGAVDGGESRLRVALDTLSVFLSVIACDDEHGDALSSSVVGLCSPGGI